MLQAPASRFSVGAFALQDWAVHHALAIGLHFPAPAMRSVNSSADKSRHSSRTLPEVAHG